MNLSDQKLLDGLNTGDMEAFSQIFHQYYSMLCAFAVQYVTLEDAENLVQDIMLSLWENRRRLAVHTSLSSYLFTAVRNRCLTYSQHNKLTEKMQKIMQPEERETYEVPDIFLNKRLTNRFMSVLASMPVAYRKAFVKNRLEGMTFKEIAETSGVSSKTIEYRIYKALEILRKELKDFLA